jgi:HEAT repeat protein
MWENLIAIVCAGIIAEQVEPLCPRQNLDTRKEVTDYIAIDDEDLKLLISELSHSDPIVRQSAAHGLGELATYARSAIPALIAALGDESMKVRATAYYALARIEPAAYETRSIEALIDALNEGEEDVSTVAAWALSELGISSKMAAPALLRMLDKCPQWDDACWWSITALGNFGSSASMALPRLEKLATLTHSRISLAAVKAINSIKRQEE